MRNSTISRVSRYRILITSEQLHPSWDSCFSLYYCLVFYDLPGVRHSEKCRRCNNMGVLHAIALILQCKSVGHIVVALLSHLIFHCICLLQLSGCLVPATACIDCGLYHLLVGPGRYHWYPIDFPYRVLVTIMQVHIRHFLNSSFNHK